MPRTETVRKTFFCGPEVPAGLIQVAQEITSGSANTTKQKQQACEDYIAAVNNLDSRKETSVDSTKPFLPHNSAPIEV